MKKEEIKSNELKRLIALKAGKVDFTDVTDEDLEGIRDIVLNAFLINGKSSDISLDAISLFPNLERIRIANFEITNEVVETFATLKKLSSIEIVGGIFTEVDFSKLSEQIREMSFANCESLSFKYPKMKNIVINRCGVDFENIDFSVAENILIQNSTVKNAHNLNDYMHIKRVNLDGSSLYDGQEQVLENILVSDNTQYSHEQESRFYDGSNNRE